MTNPEPTQAVMLADSDIEMLLNAISFELNNNLALTPEYVADLDSLFQHLERHVEV